MNELLRAIAELAGAMAWPSVALILAFAFRKEIVDLAKRLRRGGGAEFDPVPQSTAPPTNLLTAGRTDVGASISSAASDTLEGFPRTPATVSWERFLLESPQLKSIEASQEREKILVRMLARAILINQFEQADSSIWASQLELLAYLNSKRQGETLRRLKELFYDRAAAETPAWYQNYSFDGWLGFLQRNNLLALNDGLATITNEGIEYLAWRVQQARAPKLHG